MGQMPTNRPHPLFPVDSRQRQGAHALVIAAAASQLAKSQGARSSAAGLSLQDHRTVCPPNLKLNLMSQNLPRVTITQVDHSTTCALVSRSLLNSSSARRVRSAQCRQPSVLVGKLNEPTNRLAHDSRTGRRCHRHCADLVTRPLVVRLLFASELDGTGLNVARIAGMVLFAFALTCWVAARNGEPKAITVGMLVYNLLVGAYFVSFRRRAPDIGPLPLALVAVFHVVFAALLALASRCLVREDKK